MQSPLNIHILYLIVRHDCVILPGFGAFIVERIPARIDSATRTVYPSETRIGFNSELTDDDGLLIHSIARRGRLPYQDSRRIVEHSIKSFLERLTAGEIVDLAGIGCFRLIEEDRKLFTPAPRIENRAFMLPAVCTDRKQVDNTAGAVIEDKPDQNSDRVSESEGSKSDGKGHITRVIYRENSLSGRHFFSRIACALIILLGIMICFTLPEIHYSGKVQKASIVPVETLIYVSAPVDSTKLDKIEGVSEHSDFTERNERMKFHLIVGTFSSREEAEQFVAISEDDSTSLTPISGKGGMWRVAAASSDERESLRDQLNRMNKRFPGIWIWERK